MTQLHQLHLQDYTFMVALGLTPEEQRTPQQVKINTILSTPELPPACLTDSTDGLWCYESIGLAMNKELTRTSFKTLEHLTFKIWLLLARNLMPGSTLKVACTKVKPPLPFLNGGTTFVIERPINDFSYKKHLSTAGELSMTLTDSIKKAIAPWMMLKHPFYQAWSNGALSRQALLNYSLQYRPFIHNFPRYVSALHSHCETPAQRRELLRNLNDEEGYPDQKDHPTLWKDFAIELGVRAHDYENQPSETWAHQLHRSFWNRSQKSYYDGLGSLYAYEYQIPEISKFKIEALIKYFHITSETALEFFRLHQIADVYHSQSCEKLLNSIESPEHQEQTVSAAETAAKDLWKFLDQCEQAQ